MIQFQERYSAKSEDIVEISKVTPTAVLVLPERPIAPIMVESANRMRTASCDEEIRTDVLAKCRKGFLLGTVQLTCGSCTRNPSHQIRDSFLGNFVQSIHFRTSLNLEHLSLNKFSNCRPVISEWNRNLIIGLCSILDLSRQANVSTY